MNPSPGRKQTQATLTTPTLSEAHHELGVWLLIYHRDGGRLVPLSNGHQTVVGRGRSADVSIDDVSLSRQHACFELKDTQVWVEDLKSTNGTRVNGRKISAATAITPGAQVTVGAVAVTVQRLAPTDPLLRGIDNHDRFMSFLQEETERARTFGRRVAVIQIRQAGRKKGHFARSCPRIHKSLRSIDRMAMYGRRAALILLPEVDADKAREVAQSLVQGCTRGEVSLVCGVACFPDHAASAEELIEAVRDAAQQASGRHPVHMPHSSPGAPPEKPAAVWLDGTMGELVRTALRVAGSQLPVLLLGETGTGKEVLTRAIHQASPRSAHRLLCVNCGAIAADLIESTLFGHERGAFTGAAQQRKGLFEEADGGTILLDEIGELPLELQPTLLRVLETGEVFRVGSARPTSVDTRVITATNRDIEAMCAAGTFRQDLFYRLNTFVLRIPPLRERRSDILPLAHHFVQQASGKHSSEPPQIDAVTQRLLEEYDWPGNIRELRNVMERAVVLAETATITAEELPESIQRRAVRLLTEQSEESRFTPVEPTGDLRDQVESFEEDLIIRALEAADGNQVEAARALNIPIRTLFYKIRKHGIGPKKGHAKAKRQQGTR